MPENKGFYEKYRVERADGRPITGRTWTMELSHDQFALPAMKAYRAAVADYPITLPVLLESLDEVIAEMEGNTEMEGTGRPDLTG